MATASTCCIFLVVLTLASVNADYCNLQSCKGQHTMCKFSDKPAEKCNKVQSTGLTSEEKHTILDKHNELRKKVADGKEKRGSPGPQPAASNLGPLKWDNELAEIAQRWANQCNFGHDQCRNVEKYAVGQNVAIASTTGPNDIDLANMVEGWYNEVEDFDKNQVSSVTEFSKNGKQTGHYTQLVWAKTTTVGCGVIKYNDGEFNTTYLVCNYGPAGNYIGEALYKTR